VNELAQNFMISLNAIAPIFLLLALGYGLKKWKLADQSLLKGINRLTFCLFLPAMLFQNIYQTDIRQIFDWKIILYAFGCLVLLVMILWFTVPKIVKDPKRRGVVMQGIFRSNYVIFGVSVVTNMFGEEKAAIAAVLSAVLVPSYNFFAVVVLEVFTHEQKQKIGNTVKSILTNPLILASVLGIVVSLLRIDFPPFLDTTVSQIGRLATPLALLVLGGDFEFSALKGRLGTALCVSAVKLIGVPAVMVPIAVLLGFRAEELMSIVLAAASPVAVSSYIMAQQAKADGQLAGQIVMLSSILCLITMFLWIFVLKTLGLV
jgi:predicted permease